MSDVTAINRNISVPRESGSEAIRVDLRCCYSQLSSWSGGVDVGLSWVNLSWLFQRVFSCRGAEQLWVNLLDGWRRGSECLREVVRAVQRDCSHSAWVLGSSGVVSVDLRTGRVTAELSCELSGAGTARRHFIAELTDYIAIVGRGLPSTYRQRYVWVLLFIGDFDFTVRSV